MGGLHVALYTVVSATGDSSNHPLMKSSMLSGEHHCGISDWCGW